MDTPPLSPTSCTRCGGTHPPGAADCAGSGLEGRTLAGGIQVRERVGDTRHGIVYRAEEIRTGAELELLTLRSVASWTMSPGNLEEVERLWDQLSRARGIHHPNIPIVRGLGMTPDGTRYVALEMLQGELLSEILRARGTLPLDEAEDVILQAAAGLEAAHKEGVLHGSLSPDSILITRNPDGRPLIKLVRFGAAVDSSYSAPEQHAGQVGDERSDVFGLGTVLYSTLTGEPPTAGTPPAGRIPPAVWAVVSKAIEPMPARRFGTVAAFTKALLMARSHPAEEPDDLTDGAGRRVAVIAAGVAAVGVGFWLIFGFFGEPRSQAALPSQTQVSTAPAQVAPLDPAAATDPPSESTRRSRPPARTERGSAEGPASTREPEPGPSSTPPPDAQPPAQPRHPVDSAVGYAPGYAPEAAAGAGLPPVASLTETPAMRLALGDVTRLGIVADYREPRPGRLLLMVGDGYYTSTSLEYNLRQLYAAYSELLNFPKESPVLELWRGRRKLGEYTREGLHVLPD